MRLVHRRLAAALLLVVATLCASRAHATVQRFAVVVGNDAGSGEDVRLRFAQSDADKVARVLKDVGDFRPSDIVVLRGESSETFRSTLITVNERIRTAAQDPGTQTLLFVYYSGHADAQALHLGASRFDLRELGALVRGSSATFRLLMVDACRSGTLTRLKGGTVVPAFALPGAPTLQGEGMAFLTASAANEDAQESDAIGGSFFTHAWVSGLLGAADVNHDGTVMLDESYTYAYGATIRTTSQSFAGTQHPSFDYDFRGQGAIPMSHLRQRGRGFLSFPSGTAYLVLRGSSEGAVVAEVSTVDAARTLSLEPGPYFLRGRGRDVLFEGVVTVAEGQTHAVSETELTRVEYARLVRKGAAVRSVAHAVEIGPALRSSLPDGTSACIGAALGYRLDLASFGFLARAGTCRADGEGEGLRRTAVEYLLQSAVLHTWDFAGFSVGAGAGAGAVITRQRFETRGSAPPRTSASPLALATVSATVDLAQRFYVGADVLAEAYLLRIQGVAGSRAEWEPALAVRATAFGGGRF